MGYNLQQSVSDFTSPEDFFQVAAPLNPSINATSLYGGKVTDGEADSLSSFWLPAYTSHSGLDISEGRPMSLPHTSLRSTSNIGIETQGPNGISGSQHVDWLGTLDSSWPGAINSSNLEPSSHTGSLSWEATGEAAPQISTQHNSTPRTSPSLISITPLARSSCPSPSPSSSISTATSLTTKVDFDYEDSVSDNHTAGEYDGFRLPLKVCKRARAWDFSYQVATTVEHLDANPTPEIRKRKRACSTSSTSSTHISSKPPGRQRRRNVQVSDSVSVFPIPLESGRYVCPIPQCAKDMAREQEMRRHIDTHLGKGSKCPVCAKNYSRIDATLRHLKGTRCGRIATGKGLVPIPLGREA